MAKTKNSVNVSNLQPKGSDLDPKEMVAPDSLDDPRSTVDKAKDKGEQILDAAAESELVDRLTNEAAKVVREKGEKNKRKLAKKIEAWLDDVAKSHGGLLGRIIRMLPLATIVQGGLSKLVDVIADWLEEFSDASDEDEDS